MKTPEKSSVRGRWFAGLASAGALAGLVAVNLPAQAHPGAEGAAHPVKHGERHHGPEAMGQRMEQMVERVFTRVGASEEQKARAREIVKASAEEMRKLHAGHSDDRQQMLALLSADTIDRGQIEQQRAARHAQMDEASKVMTRTMADLAEVLTPAQRKEAAKSLASMGGRHGHPGKHRHGDGPRAPEATRG